MIIAAVYIFRVAVKQGNLTRVEEALKLAGVNPNVKVVSIVARNIILNLHFRHLETSPATHL